MVQKHKIWSATQLLFFAVALLLPTTPPDQAMAASVSLNIYIHKNDVNGSLWDDYSNQIKLTFEKDGAPLTVPVETTLYPFGAQYRTATNRCADADADGDYDSCTGSGTGPICVNATDCTNPKTLNEAFVSLNNITAPPDTNSTYTVKIDYDASSSQIKQYANDDPNAPSGTISTFHCLQPTDPTDPHIPVCESSITITPEAFLDAQKKNKPFRIDLVVVPVAGAAESRPEEDPLTAGTNAEYSELVTFVGRFAIRVQNLLNWTLHISQESYTNPTIDRIYSKILNIVNGFFIILMLVIAFMWNLSIIIPRRYLRKVVIMFIFSIILVNFALPVNKLMINVTNSLQNSFLVKDVRDASGITKAKITSNDILSIFDTDYGAFIGLSKTDYIGKTYPSEGTPTDFPDDPKTQFNTVPDLYMNRNQEPIWFNVVLVVLGSIGQLLLTLILLFRIIILWFFLILSPFLFILILLKFLKQFFKYWSWLYMRWLFIGPLLAISLFIVVNIWSLTGVPIESAYAPPASLWFQNATNLYLSAPGVVSGYLNTPREVMKYIASLIMLYMAVILPFWLTRRFEIFDFQPEKIFAKLKNKVTPPVKPKTPTTPPTSTPPPLTPTFTPPPNDMPTFAPTPSDMPTMTPAFTSTTEVSPTMAAALQDITASVDAQVAADMSQDMKADMSADMSQDMNADMSNSMAVDAQVEGSMVGELNISDVNMSQQISQMDTFTILQKLDMTPMSNENRNKSLSDIASRNSISNRLERENLNSLVNELDKRAKNEDKQAQRAVSDIMKADKLQQEQMATLPNMSTTDLKKQASVEQMANVQKSENITERAQVEAIHNEITKRAETGDTEAQLVSEQVAALEQEQVKALKEGSKQTTEVLEDVDDEIVYDERRAKREEVRTMEADLDDGDDETPRGVDRLATTDRSSELSQVEQTQSLAEENTAQLEAGQQRQKTERNDTASMEEDDEMRTTRTRTKQNQMEADLDEVTDSSSHLTGSRSSASSSQYTQDIESSAANLSGSVEDSEINAAEKRMEQLEKDEESDHPELADEEETKQITGESKEKTEPDETDDVADIFDKSKRDNLMEKEKEEDETPLDEDLDPFAPPTMGRKKK